MATTHLNRWIAGDGKKLTNLQKITLRLAVVAEVKEARPTVRRKPPVQQLKAEIAALISEYLTDIERGEQHRMALFIHKMRQLSAV